MLESELLYKANNKSTFLGLLRLFVKISYAFLTKKYLRNSSLVQDLKAAFDCTHARVEPLNDKTVEALEQLAFKNVELSPSEYESAGAEHYGTQNVKPEIFIGDRK